MPCTALPGVVASAANQRAEWNMKDLRLPKKNSVGMTGPNTLSTRATPHSPPKAPNHCIAYG